MMLGNGSIQQRPGTSTSGLFSWLSPNPMVDYAVFAGAFLLVYFLWPKGKTTYYREYKDKEGKIPL